MHLAMHLNGFLFIILLLESAFVVTRLSSGRGVADLHNGGSRSPTLNVVLHYYCNVHSSAEGVEQNLFGLCIRFLRTFSEFFKYSVVLITFLEGFRAIQMVQF